MTCTLSGLAQRSIAAGTVDPEACSAESAADQRKSLISNCSKEPTGCFFSLHLLEILYPNIKAVASKEEKRAATGAARGGSSALGYHQPEPSDYNTKEMRC